MDANGLLRTWDAASGQIRLTFHEAGMDSGLGLAFSADGKRMAMTGADSTVKVWDTDTWRQTLVLRGNSLVNQIAFRPDSRYLAAAERLTVKI